MLLSTLFVKSCWSQSILGAEDYGVAKIRFKLRKVQISEALIDYLSKILSMAKNIITFKNPNFTQKELDKLKEAFMIYDKNNQGVLTMKLLGTLLRYLGHSPTETEIQEIIVKMNKKTISFPEFVDLMLNKKEIVDIESGVLKAFSVFDLNQNGLISADELRQALTTLGDKLTEIEAKVLIQKAKVNQDGLIDYTIFIDSMKPKSK